MTLPLVVSPEAAAEVEEAVGWYETRSLGLGTEFARVVRATFAVIERTPFQFPEAALGIRRAVMRRFPYAAYFAIEPNSIAVLAVFHHRRHPAHWRARR